MKPLIILFFMFAILSCQTASQKLTDETLNFIAECTSGVIDFSSLRKKIEANVEEEQKNVNASASINYDEIVRVFIFSNNSASEDLKKYHFREYQSCIDKKRSTYEKNLRFQTLSKEHFSVTGDVYVEQAFVKDGKNMHTIQVGPRDDLVYKSNLPFLKFSYLFSINGSEFMALDKHYVSDMGNKTYVFYTNDSPATITFKVIDQDLNQIGPFSYRMQYQDLIDYQRNASRFITGQK